jgi:DNA repair exonuclease SbcCD nuclease subunit
MKILFTADIHIKLGQKNVPIEWAKKRYAMFIEQLVAECARCDLLVLGGDVFDRMPTMDELEVYFDLVASITIPCIIYAGNHEALKKDTTFFSYLKKSTARLNSLVTVIDDYHSIDNMDFIPYNKLKDYEKNTDNAFFSLHNKILFTHVRGEIPPHVKPEIDLSLLDRWELVLAGDLHSYENSQRNILYPGSPCTTSFHRNVVDTGVIIFDNLTLEHVWVKLQLPQLIRKTIQAGDDMPATEYHHTIYEIEGDMAELGALADSSLIDKKVVKRETDTALILDPKMTLAGELQEYLLYILQLPDSTVADIVHILHDNMDKIALE